MTRVYPESMSDRVRQSEMTV